MLRIRFLVHESPLLVAELVEAAHWRDLIACGEMDEISESLFKIESNIVLDTLILYIFFPIIRIHSCRGDPTDVSAKTSTLVQIHAMPLLVATVPHLFPIVLVYEPNVNRHVDSFWHRIP